MGENAPPPGRSGREAEILEALREAAVRDPLLPEEPPEEVSRRLVAEGLFREEPPVELVAQMLLQLDAEEKAFDPDVQPGEA